MKEGYSKCPYKAKECFAYNAKSCEALSDTDFGKNEDGSLKPCSFYKEREKEAEN